MRINRFRWAVAATAAPLLVIAGPAISATAATKTPAATPAHHLAIAAALTAQAAKTGSVPVIVELTGKQAVAQPDTRANHARHISALATEQSPVLSLLTAKGRASKVKAYSSFDLISADVTPAGLTSLAASPDVAAVVPDANIQLADPTTSQTQAAKAAGATVTSQALPPGTCSTNPNAPQLDPQALETTSTDSDVPGAKTARSLGATGAGVTVAWMAEGIDINNPEFIRPDGSKVFTDYQDFSGDGITAPTGAGEAFLDASSIAAQGNLTYNVKGFSALGPTGNCYVKVEGIAPGASLVGLKVFGNDEIATTSSFLQAIDYAVNTDHVDVLSESFGSNPFPDTSVDVIRQADAAAVAAGTVVTVSSGDAGVTSTIGSPSTQQPGVISAGATTTYRLDAQTGYGGATFPGVKGYLNDNISSLSSGGSNEAGGTVDIVAPGELNWVACTADTQQYADCTTLLGKPTNIAESGGTSESAPLTAGGAALVIQAYRQTHGGASPTPELVKEILTSTADDISAPGDQQGAGILDTYRAVQMARSIKTSAGAPTPQGNTVLNNAGQITASAAPGTAVSKSITLTNTGVSPQTVTVTGRTLGAYTSVDSASVTLSSSSPTHLDWGGINDPYESLTFTVPKGEDRLDASIAYQAASSSLSARGRLTLVDPNGNLAAYSVPQGIGNHGDVQVAKPTAGTWTAYIYSRDAADGGSLGKYVFSAKVAKYVAFGSASPSSVTISPGASASVTFSATTPTTPGDEAASVVFTSPTAGVNTAPVVLRSQIPFSTKGTSFPATLVGGNGRDTNTGQAFFYQFQVPTGATAVNAGVTLSSGPTNYFFISLVDPHGDQVASGSNQFQSNLNADPTPGLTGSANTASPEPGTWDLIVDFAPTIAGTATSTAFTVSLNGAAPTVSASSGMPTTLKQGSTTVVNLTYKNTTGAPQAIFLDPRLSTYATYGLVGEDTETQLPPVSEPTWLVPTDTTEVTQSAIGTAPIEFDYGPDLGDPDLESSSSGYSAGGTYDASYGVNQGVWYQDVSEIGPYGAVGEPSAQAVSSSTATTLAFDSTVTSPTGDLWLQATNPNATLSPVVVQPGASVTIPVTAKPTGAKGSKVSGALAIDTLDSVTPFGVIPSANQVALLPYSYTIS